MIIDPHIIRFIAYLSLFCTAMIIVVFSENLIQFFLGWELVGFCSFLLINFWWVRTQANKAALKAMFINKIGDVCLLLALVYIGIFFQAFDLHTIFLVTPFFLNVFTSNTIIFLYNDYSVLFLIGLFLVIAAAGKSAQLGLHVWLPDAMEGPTPVSALIHAATMVTIGIFLLIRYSIFFEFVPFNLILISFIGIVTALSSSFLAVFQSDIKKIIAYSTCSQLGYMFLACGLSLFNISFFHLVNHAFFKALLFLTVGCIIHIFNGEQNIRVLNFIIFYLPFTSSIINIANFSLLGLVYFSGFYSKDFLLELVYFDSNLLNFFLWGSIFTLFLTNVYSYSFLNVFLSQNFYFFAKKYNFLYSSEASLFMSLVFLCLMLFSLLFGFFFYYLYVDISSNYNLNSLNFFYNVLFIENNINVELVCFLILINFIFFEFVRSNENIFELFHVFFVENFLFTFILFVLNKFGFDQFITQYSFAALKIQIYNFFLYIDKGLLEFCGPTNLSRAVYYISYFFSRNQYASFLFYLNYLVFNFFFINYFIFTF
jgi:NADH:ubiquinone oxidoreductase subunit 5 (subunit L)/multisubunit Na+/H+ antiporter MnhA subunit